MCSYAHAQACTHTLLTWLHVNAMLTFWIGLLVFTFSLYVGLGPVEPAQKIPAKSYDRDES